MKYPPAPLVVWLWILCSVILAGCTSSGSATGSTVGAQHTPPAAPGPTPAHGHLPVGHEAPLGAGGVASLVLVRRLDGINSHEGGPGVVGERFGIFAIADDMDRDGTLDLIVGAPRADPRGITGTNDGSVFVYSGAALMKGAPMEKALLYRVDGEVTANGTGELGFRQSLATVDFDGDGFPDLVAGAWLADPIVGGEHRVDGGTVAVFNGATLLRGAPRERAIMFRLEGEPGSRLGRPVANVGDINRDGIPDVFVGAHRTSPGGVRFAGSGFLISGDDFSILHRFDGGAANDFLGRSVMAVGDLNGDGYPDLAIGGSQGDGGQAGAIPAGAGYVNVYSGKDYSLLHRLTPPDDEPTGSFGQTTVYTPEARSGVDLNGDGVPDVIVGSPEAKAGVQGPPGKEGFPRTGSVYVYSGADFSLLYRLDGERGSSRVQEDTPLHETPRTGVPEGNTGDVFGDAVAVVPDMDGDGVAEIVIGAPRGDGQSANGSYLSTLTDAGYAKIFSGAQGELLIRLNGDGQGTNMGHHVISVPDINGDGLPDILVGSDLTDYGGTDAGSLYWYTISINKPVE